MFIRSKFNFSSVSVYERRNKESLFYFLFYFYETVLRILTNTMKRLEKCLFVIGLFCATANARPQKGMLLLVNKLTFFKYFFKYPYWLLFQCYCHYRVITVQWGEYLRLAEVWWIKTRVPRVRTPVRSKRLFHVYFPNFYQH